MSEIKISIPAPFENIRQEIRLSDFLEFVLKQIEKEKSNGV